jgi:fumarylacetoacetase
VIEASLKSWVDVPAGSDFPVQNLPYGAFERDGEVHLGIAIGDKIFDLYASAQVGLFEGVLPRLALQGATLNPLLAAGCVAWAALRERAAELLRDGTAALDGVDREPLLADRLNARMHLPFHPGDYVDFYSSLEHATNLGKIFRPNGEPLMPNWRWIPIGYHGRSSTIVVGGTPVVRPSGQRKAPDAAAPSYGPSQLLDIELEVGFITGPGNAMGTRISTSQAQEQIFGLVLVNDWSARDIQAWEYQPLGPFLGKSFATSVSPWVVTLDALEPYRVPGPAQDPAPLEYLRCDNDWNFDINLEVDLQTSQMSKRGIAPETISRSNYKYLYWNMAQQLAHASVNGTAIRPGDLYASGTISGDDPQSYGSLIELTWRGARPLHLRSAETRAFLEDGDTVTIRGWSESPGKPRIGFGSVSGTILTAKP